MSLALHIVQQGGDFDQLAGFTEDHETGERRGFGRPSFAAASPTIAGDLLSKARVEIRITETFTDSLDGPGRTALGSLMVIAAHAGRPFTALVGMPPPPAEPFVALVSYDAARDWRGSAACRVCGCTHLDCQSCIDRTGAPCSWAEEPDWLTCFGGLCSACAPVPCVEVAR